MSAVTLAYHDSGTTCVHARGCAAAGRKTKLDYGPPELRDTDMDVAAHLANPDEGAIKVHSCLSKTAGRTATATREGEMPDGLT